MCCSLYVFIGSTASGQVARFVMDCYSSWIILLFDEMADYGVSYVATEVTAFDILLEDPANRTLLFSWPNELAIPTVLWQHPPYFLAPVCLKRLRDCFVA